MPTIAIVDDRQDARNRVRSFVELGLGDESAKWTVIAFAPLDSIEDYPRWIVQNDIAVLLVDERLHESREAGGETVSYDGHDVITILRSHHRDFPIFIVSSHIEDENIAASFKNVEGVINREVLHDDYLEYTPRFVRAGNKFFETYQSELQKLNEYSEKIANGQEISNQERDTAKAIREKMAIAYDIESLATRREWIEKFEDEISSLKVIADEMSDFLTNKKK